MSELYHHGIKGQRWGQRNGPPYPLDYDDHSYSEKKFGIRSGSEKQDSIKNKDNKNRKPKPNETAIEYSKYIGKKIGRNKETGLMEYERVDRPSNKYIRDSRNEFTAIFVDQLQDEDNKRSLKDGKKFDLVLYVLVTGFSPLKIYVYDDGGLRRLVLPRK